MDQMQINPDPGTRDALLTANHTLWAINLRHHRGDAAFRERVHQMRTETAELLEAMERTEEARQSPSPSP